jgi:hypothetical protein
MMNVDVTTGVMFKGGPLIDVCMLILNINNVRELQGQQRRDILRRYLKNLTFKMTQPLKGGRERVYKITDISGSAAEIRFLNKEGEEITVAVRARDYTNSHTILLTNIDGRIISGILEDPFSSQLYSVSKLARPNSNFLWSSVNSSLANNSRNPLQILT